MESGIGGLDFYLIGEIAAESDPRATDGADQVSTVGELPNLNRLAESEVPKLVAAGTFQSADLKITPNLSLSETQQAV
jgi:hypothetical protein